MFWSLELDLRPGEDTQTPALVPLMAQHMEGGLMRGENELVYPFSSRSIDIAQRIILTGCPEYDNLRSGQV